MSHRRAFRIWTFVLLTGLWAVAAKAQPATRVADLNTTHRSQFVDPVNPNQEFEALGNVLLFVTEDGIHGYEIWRTDGTAAGTHLVKDICPGACDAGPSNLSVWNGFLFFTASDGAHGKELWKTDGTAAGTTLVADLHPGLRSGITFTDFMDAGGVLFFTADDGVHGQELWKTDGTPAGTQLVKDVYPGPMGSVLLLAASAGQVLFGAWDDSHGFEPWISDGTEAGTVLLGDFAPGVGGSVQIPSFYSSIDGPNAFPAPQGGFLFSADDGSGPALWHTDGTPSGTAPLKRIGSSHGMTLLNGGIYFVATTPEAGAELWKTDGTEAGTMLVKDIRPGPSGSEPKEITAAGNRLFFHATDDTHGDELWVSDGTTAGTRLVRDVTPGSAFGTSIGFYPYDFGISALGDDVVFMGYAPGGAGLQVWRSDGTATGTVQLGPSGQIVSPLLPDTAMVAGARFYFRTDLPNPDIWTSDGTVAGTHEVRELYSISSAFFVTAGQMRFPGTFGTLGDLLYLQASDGSGLEPWRSNGTSGGTWQIAGIGVSDEGSFPHLFKPLDDQMVFLAYTFPPRLWASNGTAGGTHPLSPEDLNLNGSQFLLSDDSVFFTSRSSFSLDTHLWKTDGTPAGTVQWTSFPFSSIGHLVASGGKVFFTASTQLVMTDGTTPGMILLVTTSDGMSFSSIRTLTDVGGALFFTTTVEGHEELWKTDGTPASTTRVKDLWPGSVTGGSGVAAGTLLFFIMNDGVTGPELWKSDGTSDGTARVLDIFPGSRGSEIAQLTAAGNKVYFVADDCVHGRELWVSDGTGAGTHLVADLLPGPGSSVPSNLAAVGSTLLFSAFDGILGVEPWRTDGSLLGTRRVQDIAPGPLSSSPLEFTTAGPTVFFAANDNTTGFELWTVPKASILATFGDVPTTYWASPYVEALAAAGLTTGCGDGLYCPTRSVSRAEMAVFVLRVAHGTGYVPPDVTASRFADVPTSYWALDWIEQLAVEGITSGCSVSPPLYCPESPTARDQMAVFLLRALHGAAYTPPPATGTVFTDVPASYWAAAWIEQLAAEGITTGCAPNLYCPGDPVSRDQMAVFLTRALNLPLP